MTKMSAKTCGCWRDRQDALRGDRMRRVFDALDEQQRTTIEIARRAHVRRHAALKILQVLYKSGTVARKSETRPSGRLIAYHWARTGRRAEQ
jgi:predicted transcriptional regulator